MNDFKLSFFEPDNYPVNEEHPVTLFPNYLEYKNSNSIIFELSLNGTPTLLLGAFVRKFLFFKWLEPSSGIIATSSNGINYENKFLDLLIEYAMQNNFDWISHSDTCSLFNTYAKTSEWIEFGSYVINLNQDINIIKNNIHPKHRNSIASAEKKGVTVSFDKRNSWLAYDLYVSTLKRSGKKYISKNAFQKLLNLNENIIVCTAWSCAGNLEGCAILLFSKFSSYYFLGGSAEKPTSGAINLMHWKAIIYLKALNVSRYDFMGARIGSISNQKILGIQNFKKRFGGELVTGYLWRYVVNRYKYNLYKMIRKIASFPNGYNDLIDIIGKKID